MRKVKWSDYQARRAGFTRARAKSGLRRKSSSRVRDKGERRLLFQLDRTRLKSWKEEGKFEVLGPRKVRFKA